MMAARQGYEFARRAGMATLRLVRVLCLSAMPCLLLDLWVFGIVSQGVRSAVPMLIRAESLARYELLLDSDQVDLVEASYSEPNASGVRIFAGRPSQLQTFSPLSLAFCSCAKEEGSLGIAEGFQQVRDEYACLGICQSSMRDAYIMRSVRDISSCVLACLVDCGALWLLGRGHNLDDDANPMAISPV
ncbi:MAG: hypothetical protein IJ092_07120 [Atopobiaceae bacterium]|nr:hypothetical protein [Atopobiaceae bacterium]